MPRKPFGMSKPYQQAASLADALQLPAESASHARLAADFANDALFHLRKGDLARAMTNLKLAGDYAERVSYRSKSSI